VACPESTWHTFMDSGDIGKIVAPRLKNGQIVEACSRRRNLAAKTGSVPPGDADILLKSFRRPALVRPGQGAIELVVQIERPD